MMFRQDSPIQASNSDSHAYEAIRQHMQNGKLDEAKAMLLAKIKEAPQDGELQKIKNELAAKYLEIGKRQYSSRSLTEVTRGDYSKSIATLTIAIELDPNLADAYASRARAYLSDSQYVNATGDIVRAYEIRPQNQDYIELAEEIGWAAARRGKYAYSKGDYEQCIANLEAANSILEPESSRLDILALSYLGLAQKELKEGKNEGAQNHVTAAMEAKQSAFYLARSRLDDPKFDSEAFCLYGKIFMGEKDWQGAYEAYTHAAKKDENNSEAYFGLAQACAKLGMHDEAAKYYEKASELGERGVLLIFGRAQALQASGKIDEALKEFRKAKVGTIGGNYTSSFVSKIEDGIASLALDFEARGKQRLSAGKYGGAAADFELSLELGGTSASPSYGAAKAYFELGAQAFIEGNYSQASKLLTAAGKYFEQSGYGILDAMGNGDLELGASIFGRLCESEIYLKNPKNAHDAYKKGIAYGEITRQRLTLPLAECYNTHAVNELNDYISRNGGRILLDEFEAAASLAPQNMAVRLNLGMAAYFKYLNSGEESDFALSQTSLSTVIISEPGNQRAYEYRGRLCLEAGDLDGAAADFAMLGDKKLAQELLQKTAKEWVKLARQSAYKSKWEECLEQYAAAGKLDPSSIGRDRRDISGAIGKLYSLASDDYNEARLDEAKKKLGIVLEFDKYNYNAMLMLGNIAAIEQDAKTAQGYYSQILATADKFSESAIRNEAADAIKSLAPIWISDANKDMRYSDYAQAYEKLHQAILLDNKNAKAWAGIAECLGALGNENRALEAYGKAIELDPNYVGAYIARSGIYAQSDKIWEALDDLNSALEIARKNDDAKMIVECYWARANLYLGLDMQKEAQYELTRCIEEYEVIEGTYMAGHAGMPNFSLGSAYYQRARIYLSNDIDIAAQEDLIRALEVFEKENLPKSSMTESYYLLGNLSARLGDDAKALHYIELAMQTGVESARAYTLRGEIKLRLSEYSSAWDDFTKAIALDPQMHSAYSGRVEAILQITNPGEGEREAGIEAKKAEAYRNIRTSGVNSIYVQAMQDVQKALSMSPREEGYVSQRAYLNNFTPINMSRLCQAGNAGQAISALEGWKIRLSDEQKAVLENFAPGTDPVVFVDNNFRAYIASWENGLLNISKTLTADDLVSHEWMAGYSKIAGKVEDFADSKSLIDRIKSENVSLSRQVNLGFEKWLAGGEGQFVLVNEKGERLIAKKTSFGYSLFANNEEFDAAQAVYANWGEINSAYAKLVAAKTKGVKLRYKSKTTNEGWSNEDLARLSALAHYNEERMGIPAFITIGVPFYEGGNFRTVKDGHTGAWAFTPSGVWSAIEGFGQFNAYLSAHGRRPLNAKIGYQYFPADGRWGDSRIATSDTRKAGYAENLTNPAVEIFYFDCAFMRKAGNSVSRFEKAITPEAQGFADALTGALYNYNGNDKWDDVAGMQIREAYQHNCFDACIYFMPSTSYAGEAPKFAEEFAPIRQKNADLTTPMLKGKDYDVYVDEEGGRYTALHIKRNDRIALWCPEEPTKGIAGNDYLAEISRSGTEPIAVLSGGYYDWINYSDRTMAPTGLYIMNEYAIWNSQVDQVEGRDNKREDVHGHNFRKIADKAKRDIKTFMVQWVDMEGVAHIDMLTDFVAKKQDPNNPTHYPGVPFAEGNGPYLFVNGEKKIYQDNETDLEHDRRVIVVSTSGESLEFAIKAATYEDSARFIEKEMKKRDLKIAGAYFDDGGGSAYEYISGHKKQSMTGRKRKLPFYKVVL